MMSQVARRFGEKRVVLAAVLLATASPAWASSAGAAPADSMAAAVGTVSLNERWVFEENRGQLDPEVRFVSRGGDYTLFLTPREVVLVLPPGRVGSPAAVLRMRPAGAAPGARLTGVDQIDGVHHYYRGADPVSWQSGVPIYRAVRYEGVEPGIGLLYYSSEGSVEYDVEVAPGVDPERFRWEIDGAAEIRLGAGGELMIETPAGHFVGHPPRVYQERDGRRQELPARYRLEHDGTIGFHLEDHDPSLGVVIDPRLEWVTYLGGGAGGGGFADGARDGADFGVGIAVGGDGAVYVTGVTSAPDFPTASPLPHELDGFNPFIAKLTPDGRSLIYATYLPGTRGSPEAGAGFNGGTAIAVDSDGNAYVAGLTQALDFPTTARAIQPRYGGGLADAFVLKLDPHGKLLYSTYLGGAGFESAGGLAIDELGHAYVSGPTGSDDFPVVRALQEQRLGGQVFGGLDVFVAKLDAHAENLVFSTYLGGTGDEINSGVAVDRDRNVLLTGWTSSADFPTVAAAQPHFAGGISAGFGVPTDAWVSKLSADGSELIYSTFLGGTGAEYPLPDNFTSRVAVDARGHAYVTGDTASDDFPVTGDAVQSHYGGGASDAFVVELDPEGAVVFSSYLGGSGDEQGRAIVVGPAGRIQVAGRSSSEDFPGVVSSWGSLGGDGDVFVATVAGDGSHRRLETIVFGGEKADGALGLAVDRHGGLFVTGSTFSGDFPVTEGALLGRFAGGPEDGFVAKLDLSAASYLLHVPAGLSSIAVPLEPPVPLTARGLAELLGATVVLRFDSERQRFESFTPESGDEGFPIVAGEGYFIHLPAARDVTFRGGPWRRPETSSEQPAVEELVRRLDAALRRALPQPTPPEQ